MAAGGVEMYYYRDVEATIEKVSRSFPCIALYGARQTGKSTTINKLFGDRCGYVTLDDEDERFLAVENPKVFLDNYEWPLVIDEIQKAPNMLSEIKKRIDAQRIIWLKNDQPQELMYVLTGSNRFELQQGISESLAGRCGVVEMSSFSRPERMRTKSVIFKPDFAYLKKWEKDCGMTYASRKQIFREIFDGGMPDIVTGKSDRTDYFRAYVSTYIEKDVRRLISADSELKFRNFISYIALRTGQEVHYDIFARDLGIDSRTCARWLSILETSGIVFLLQPYFPNRSKRIIKAPKLYFLDTGLCSYLCRWQDSEMLERCAMSGAIFETFVVSELVKNLISFDADPSDHLFWYRDKDQREIDIVFDDGACAAPIEIKKGISPYKAAKNFPALEKVAPEVGQKIVVDTCEKIRLIDENTFYLPAYLL